MGFSEAVIEISMANSITRRCFHVTGAREGGPHVIEDASIAGALLPWLTPEPESLISFPLRR